MAEHGTRTMYVHYMCRCEACCKAEHEQYLKRKETQNRRRVYSKWGDIPQPAGREAQRAYNAQRYDALRDRPSTHTTWIVWSEIADAFNMKCAICGCEVDQNDTWTGKNGRTCYGRRYPTVDHIIPLKQNGTDTLDNVQLACKRCNSSKGAGKRVSNV